jgi:hypothetical protein
MAGTSGRSIVQKLGIKPGFRIFAAGLTVDYAEMVGALPAGVRLVPQPTSSLDMVHLFATGAAGLAGQLGRCREAIAADGMIWVSWPKKSSGVPTDLSDIVVRQTGLPLGLVDVKVCAIDHVWSGLKFVIPKEQRGNRAKRQSLFRSD